MVLNVTQQYFCKIVAVSFIDGGKSEYPEKTTNIPLVTDKRSHHVISSTPHHESDSQL
jgi:hypothetical protein